MAGPLPICRVSFKSYLPSEKIYLSWTTRRDFFLSPEYYCLICADYFMKEMEPFSVIFTDLKSIN